MITISIKFLFGHVQSQKFLDRENTRLLYYDVAKLQISFRIILEGKGGIMVILL